MSTYMANVYIAEGIVYMAASYRDAGRVTRNQLRESGDQVQGMWQTGILQKELDTRHLQMGMWGRVTWNEDQGIWRPNFEIIHRLCTRLYTLTCTYIT